MDTFINFLIVLVLIFTAYSFGHIKGYRKGALFVLNEWKVTMKEAGTYDEEN